MRAMLRRMLTLLILTAYIGAVGLQLVPVADAMSASSTAGMAHDQDKSPDRMPCKGTTTAPCMGDLGCVFLVGLPNLPNPTSLSRTTWSPVQYPGSPRIMHGRSVKPAIGPPISLA